MRAALITILVASVVVTAQNDPPTENGIQSSTSGYQYPNYPFRQNQFYTNTFNGFGGNLNFVPSGSHSILSSNGNNIVISRRMNADNKPEDYISISNPSIRIDGGYFACGSLICPANTFKCAVTSETLASDRKQMKTTAECFDKSGKKLDSKMYNEINPFPELEPPYSRIATVDRDGAIHTEDSNGQNTFRSNTLTKEQTEALARGISEQTRRIEAQIAEQQRHFQAQMEQLHRNLEQTFSRNFPFGNSFSYGYNFPFGNHFPFANNFPFGYEPYPPYNYRTPFNPNYGQPPTTANVFYPETSDPNDVY